MRKFLTEITDLKNLVGKMRQLIGRPHQITAAEDKIGELRDVLHNFSYFQVEAQAQQSC